MKIFTETKVSTTAYIMRFIRLSISQLRLNSFIITFDRLEFENNYK